MKFGGIFGVGKPLGESNLIEFISQFSELTCEKDIYFSVDFVVGNSNKLQNWVWKEKSVEPSMYSHLGQQHRLY